MNKRQWTSIALAAGLLVFGAGVTVGKVTDSYQPTASVQQGVINGNMLYYLDPSDQLAYVVGVWDAYYTVVEEALQMIRNGNHPVQVVGKLVAVIAKDNIREEDRLLLKGAVESYLPANVTIGQVKDVVVAYLKDHPTERQNNGALLVWRALAQAEWK
ncbi:MAG: hypothetical protein IMX00_04350 [Limnochordales bacterium]|nr:hypothetical protein [Limnochordales bacterium]